MQSEFSRNATTVKIKEGDWLLISLELYQEAVIIGKVGGKSKKKKKNHTTDSNTQSSF